MQKKSTTKKKIINTKTPLRQSQRLNKSIKTPLNNSIYKRQSKNKSIKTSTKRKSKPTKTHTRRTQKITAATLPILSKYRKSRKRPSIPKTQTQKKRNKSKRKCIGRKKSRRKITTGQGDGSVQNPYRKDRDKEVQQNKNEARVTKYPLKKEIRQKENELENARKTIEQKDKEIVIELDKKRGTNKYTSLFFIKHFMELLEKQKGALYKKLIEMMKLIQSGLQGCQKKFKSRLLDRGYDWLFVQVYRVMIKEVMGGNDICEGALGSISSLVIGGGQMLNALEASTLCEWTKNETMQFLNNENNLQKAANVVFNHKPSIRKLNTTHKEDKRNNLKELYRKKVKESDLIKIKQTCKRNDALYLYKQHISLKYNFGESKKYFLKIYAYQTKEIKKNKTRRTMKRIQNDWINDGLRYFIHVLHKKKDENILLTGRNGTLKKKENKLMKLINKYGFWSMGTNLIFKQIETDILLKLNTDISIFMDSDQEQEEHDRYLDPQLYYLENFTHNV